MFHIEDPAYQIVFIANPVTEVFRVQSKVLDGSGHWQPASLKTVSGAMVCEATPSQTETIIQICKNKDNVVVGPSQLVISLVNFAGVNGLLGGGAAHSRCGDETATIAPYQLRIGIPLALQPFDEPEIEFIARTARLNAGRHKAFTEQIRNYFGPGISIFSEAWATRFVSLVNPQHTVIHLYLQDVDTINHRFGEIFLYVRVALQDGMLERFRHGQPESVPVQRGDIVFDVNTLFIDGHPVKFRSSLGGASSELRPFWNYRPQDLSTSVKSLLRKTIVVLCQVGSVRTVTVWEEGKVSRMRRSVDPDFTVPATALRSSRALLHAVCGADEPHSGKARCAIGAYPNQMLYTGLWKDGLPHGPGIATKNLGKAWADGLCKYFIFVWQSGDLITKIEVPQADMAHLKADAMQEKLKALTVAELEAITSLSAFKAQFPPPGAPAVLRNRLQNTLQDSPKSASRTNPASGIPSPPPPPLPPSPPPPPVTFFKAAVPSEIPPTNTTDATYKQYNRTEYTHPAHVGTPGSDNDRLAAGYFAHAGHQHWQAENYRELAQNCSDEYRAGYEEQAGKHQYEVWVAETAVARTDYEELVAAGMSKSEAKRQSGYSKW